MKTSLYHLQINVLNPEVSLPFYKDFFNYFGHKIIGETPSHLGVSNGTTDFWFMETESTFKSPYFHRKNTGLNHLAFKVESREDVDRFTEEFLKPRNLPPLYESPKAFPDYSENYYAVFFEGPDRLKIEVVFN